MNIALYVTVMLALVALFAVALGAFLYGGYRWGAFAALTARAQNRAKWQAYLLALVPPAALALALLCNSSLYSVASRAFVTLAAPAVIGTGLRYNRRGVAAHY